MKIEIDLHDSRKERPERSCHVIAFSRFIDGDVYGCQNVTYSALHNQFNNDDYFDKNITPYGEHDGLSLYWAYFDDVAEAIRQAEVREG